MSEPEESEFEEKPGEPSADAAEEMDMPIPPASFEFFVYSLRMQAEMHMGMLHFGSEEERPKPNMPLAQHSIDMLGVLQEKTKGNLTWEEERALQNTLTELRFRFVQANESKIKL